MLYITSHACQGLLRDIQALLKLPCFVLTVTPRSRGKPLGRSLHTMNFHRNGSTQLCKGLGLTLQATSSCSMVASSARRDRSLPSN